MIWRLLEGQDVQPKYLVSACPKHGLHLASMLVEGVCQRQPESIYNANHWHGTFQFNSFAPVWQNMSRWFFLASRLQQGYFLQGHVGYRADIETFLAQSRIAHVFIYRDLRDAAVSQAYHILSSNNTKFRHAGKSAYRCLGGLDEILTAVIEGLGGYPGIVELWELYAGWLDAPNTHALKFEDAIADLEGAARGILQHGLNEITRDIWEVPFRVEQSLFDQQARDMAASADRRDLSPTFRRGKPGEWQHTFTDEHKALFKAKGGSKWLTRLRYEESDDW